MRAGQLRQRVTIEQATETRGATYQDVQRVWIPVATVWAAVEPLSGREFFANRQAQSELQIRVRIRYRSNITPKMRLIHGARTYEIQAVINVENRNRELQLMCAEFANA